MCCFPSWGLSHLVIIYALVQFLSYPPDYKLLWVVQVFNSLKGSGLRRTDVTGMEKECLSHAGNIRTTRGLVATQTSDSWAPDRVWERAILKQPQKYAKGRKGCAEPAKEENKRQECLACPTMDLTQGRPTRPAVLPQ